MGESFTLPVADPQPSQPFLNGRKLALATEWFDFDEPNYDPVPVRRLAEGVTEVADLFGRALNADAFVEQWVERCEGLGE